MLIKRKIVADETKNERKKTTILHVFYAIVFLILVILAISISFYAFTNCYPWYTYYNTDSWGNQCLSFSHRIITVPGVNGSGKIIQENNYVWPLNFYTRFGNCFPNKTTIITQDLVKICVKTCPNKIFEYNRYNNCQVILEENDYNGNEYTYAANKCKDLELEEKSCSESVIADRLNGNTIK